MISLVLSAGVHLFFFYFKIASTLSVDELLMGAFDVYDDMAKCK